MPDLYLDATLGVSGDMLLAALVDAGADTAFIKRCVRLAAPEASISFSETHRREQRALHLEVSADTSDTSRTWETIRSQLSAAGLPTEVLQQALRVFQTLAEAEAAVHGTDISSIHFHEVGATDALIDIVGNCAALISLAPGRVTSSRIATGTGYASTAHGNLPVPVPAVSELLAGTGAVLVTGPAEFEACTPTGAALLAVWTQAWSDGPAMRIDRIGIGAGSRDPAGHPNITRAFVGESTDIELNLPDDAAVLLECNIDDMDPRLWPTIIASLMAAGALDAWLTPILMKKGRPAHTLHILANSQDSDALISLVMKETSTIGLRKSAVDKVSLRRRTETVEVLGHPVRIKLAFLGDQLTNVQPEWEDVAAIAAATGEPAKDILAKATSVASRTWN